MIDHRKELQQNLDEVFGWLRRATADVRSPFRQPVLTTVGAEGVPESRILVLREITPGGHLVFFTDGRTPKTEALRQNPRAALLFWDPRKQVQLSMQAHGIILEDKARLAGYRARVKGRAQQSYTTSLPPGTAVDAPEAARSCTDFETTNYFTVLEFRPVSLTVLELGPEHLRFKAVKTADGWQANWVVP